MELKRLVSVLLTTICISISSVFGQGESKLPELKFSQYTLKNGLRVVLHQDRSTPIVAVNIWYHVGSKNEVPGKTGFAHLFEHLMFNGSAKYDDDFFKPLQDAGGSLNGSTTPDRTNYYEVIPSNFLEMALFLEADRMGNLLPTMTLEKINNQRDVVKNERRQRYDNAPYGTALEKIQSIIYPPEHPYHWATIGSLKDLTNASLGDVKSFFQKYYAPNNASLVIAGDFDEKRTKKWVEKYFGTIHGGTKIDRPTPAVPKLEGEVRRSFEDQVRLPRRYFVWHSAPSYDPDQPALEVLGSILATGRGARLQRALFYDRQLVQDVTAYNNSRELGGSFNVIATARPGVSPEEIEKIVDAELQKLKDSPPMAEEVERAKNGYESNFVYNLETILKKADQLNAFNTFLNKPDLFQSQLDKYLSVTPQDVQRVARKYLTRDRLVMTFVPGSKQGAPEAEDENRPTSVTDSTARAPKVDYSKNLPKPGPDPKLRLPYVQKAKLSNGLNVWIVPHKELPIAHLNMVIESGSVLDPSGKEGLSSFTTRMLDKGTKTRSALEISNLQQDLGLQFNIYSGAGTTNVTVQTLTKHLDNALALFADLITNADFPEAELENIRQPTLVRLLQKKDSGWDIAEDVYDRLIYGPDHPYGKPTGGTETSVKSISRDDLVNFYHRNFLPNAATLIIVGDVDQAFLMPKLEKVFGDWKPGNVRSADLADPTNSAEPGIYLVDRPRAAQSEIRIGHIGVARNSPDYVPLLVMNQILGGNFSARLNMNLREDKGYTYGARSNFVFGKIAGPFTASAAVQTAVTKESVVEFMKELNGIRGTIPVTEKELEDSKQSMIRRFPQTIEATGRIADQLVPMIIYGLPDGYLNDYLAKIARVTLEDIDRVSKKYLHPEKMQIVIVGDRKVIEPRLKEIDGWGNSIHHLDWEGNSLKEDAGNE